MKKLLFCVFVVSFLCVVSPSLFSQVSVNVSPLDPVYRDLEKLIGNGLVDRVIWGQRPFSRQEIGRITAEAIRHRSRLIGAENLSEKEKQKLQDRLTYTDTILERLKKDYAEELVQEGVLEGEKPFYSLHPLEKVITDTVVTNSPPEQLPLSNGIGDINAVINPLIDYRQGRHLVDGATLSLETTHWFRVSKYFALYAQPRFQLGIGRDGFENDNQAFVENLSGKFNVKNFEIQIGRDNLVWGQGQDAGLLLSNNPRGLDMIKISNDEPAFLPWVFRYLGANKISFFYADLGPEQYYKNSYLVGYKWSLEPLSFLEVGASLMTMAGGEGSPSASFGERVKDIFPYSGSGNGSGEEISNHIATLDWRLRVPRVRNFEFYGEFGWDDDWNPFSRTKQLFVEDGAWVVGLYFPRLTNAGNVDFRAEYQKTGKRFYRHGQFLGGWTLNQFIMGDNLGPDAQGVYATVNWDLNPQHLFKFLFAYEDRSADQYIVPPTDVFEFEKTVNNPNEYRYRALAQYMHRVEGFPLNLWLNLGYEHVNNFEFIDGNNRNNFLGEIALEFNLDQWTKTAR